MRTATLTFELPDDEEEFLHAQKGEEYYGALSDLDHYLRFAIKGGESAQEIDTLERVRDELQGLWSE